MTKNNKFNDENNAIINEAIKLYKEGKIKNNADVENFIDNLIQPLYQKMLDTELDNLLDYSKYEHKNNSSNYRNGYCKAKKVQTKYGTMMIKTPRDRNGEFEPVIIKKGENRLGKFEDIILSMCAKGMSYRDISKMLTEIYGVDISKDKIAKFVDTISETVNTWLSRPLEKCYVFAYADCLYIPVRNDINSAKKAFYVIIGVNVYGKKDVLGIWCDDNESASFWTSVFEDLKQRGVEDILYMTSDGVAGFKGSLESVFPKTTAQRCVVHLVRNLYKICPKKRANKIIQAFKKIYTASNIDIAQIELENFKEEFSDLEKVCSKVEEDMQYLNDLFELPFEMRKAIYTSNSIESVNSALRKVTNGKGSFSSIASVYKLLFLRVDELSEKWTKPIPNWKTIQAQISEIFGERYTKYLNI